MSGAFIRDGRGLDRAIEDGLVIQRVRVAPDGDDEEIEAAEPVMLHRVDPLWKKRLERPAKQEREVDVPGRRSVGDLEQLQLGLSRLVMKPKGAVQVVGERRRHGTLDLQGHRLSPVAPVWHKSISGVNLEFMEFYQDHIVPALVNLAMRTADHVPYRKRALSLARGRVLEIGIGSGLNLPFYTEQVTGILGLEPQPKLLAMASRKTSIVPMKLVEGSAESIPLDDGSVDTVVTTWSLCSIPDPLKALAEVRRVLKPAGQLVFVEHGLAPEEKVRKWQHRLTPVWKRFTGGCHLDWPISDLVQDAGYRIEQLETGYMRGPKLATFTYEGLARPS